MLNVPPKFAEIVQRNTGYIGTAPCGNLAVSVLSDNEGMHGTVINGKVLSQKIFQSCGVQYSSGAEYPILREAAKLYRRIG